MPTQTAEPKVALIKISGNVFRIGALEETIAFPEPVPGTKSGTITGIHYKIDFFLLDSGDWHCISYHVRFDTPLSFLTVSFDNV